MGEGSVAWSMTLEKGVGELGAECDPLGDVSEVESNTERAGWMQNEGL